ncbi:MAG: SoxR reducing system RseC family protein [Neisseriaceae bacterium]|nr:SoxR reducing system RseC family protein [Neisseriaceae bacterium]
MALIYTDAQVLRLNSLGDRVTITPKPCSLCSKCDTASGCRQLNIGRFFGNTTPEFTLENTLNLKVGDWVRLSIEDKALLHSAYLMYLLPLIALILGAAIGQLINESWSVFFGLSALCLSFVAVHYYLKLTKNTAHFHPTLLSLLPESELPLC